MKNLLAIALCLLLISCSDKKTPTKPLPFFHFDRVEYYHLGITKEEVTEIGIKQDKTRKEQALLQILTGNVPVNTRDTLFINNMEILHFKKQDIDPKLHDQFSDLFSVRETKDAVTPACVAVYRDILVFRNKDKVIGVARISFDCGLSQIVGARYNASNFGHSGEYEKLRKLLPTQ